MSARVGITELLILLLPLIFCAIVIALPCSRIFAKAGHSPWLCLTLFVPLVNLIILFWFAFSTWPIEAELLRWRQSAPKPPNL